MKCPVVSELPPPPAGKTGWPWTDEATTLPPARRDGSPWPLVSMITPSYNQGQFIEETIRSVLLQGYPELEYIVIDGGSQDQSVEIIKKYEPWLSYWVSERDRGQSHAINKGFDRSTGLILGWLNSDDILLPNALATIAVNLPHPEEPALLAGTAEIRDVSLTRVILVHDRTPRTFFDVFSQFDTSFAQPSVFFSRKALRLAGNLREDLHYAMDLDLWLRIARHVPITVIEQHLSWWRAHDDSKTWSGDPLPLEEGERVLQSYSRFVPAEIAKRTFASSHREQSSTWIRRGKNLILGGDRKNAWIAAYKAARLNVRTIGSRGWIGLLLRLILPRTARHLVFGVHAGY
jgi:hypothetical protein